MKRTAVPFSVKSVSLEPNGTSVGRGNVVFTKVLTCFCDKDTDSRDWSDRTLAAACQLGTVYECLVSSPLRNPYLLCHE